MIKVIKVAFGNMNLNLDLNLKLIDLKWLDFKCDMIWLLANCDLKTHIIIQFKMNIREREIWIKIFY